MVNDVSVLAELALYTARLPPDQPLPLRLCSAGVTLLGASGGSVTLTSVPGAPYPLAATDAVAERAESLQDVFRAGPRFEAQTTVQPATLVVGAAPETAVPDGPAVDGWALDGLALEGLAPDGPALDSPATKASSSLTDELRVAVGPVCVRAFPMVVAGAVLGVFSVHLPHDTRLSRQDDEALVVASIIGGALLRDAGESSSMLSGWPVRARVHQATSMVAAQLEVTPEDALTLIRAHARAHDSTVSDVVSALAEGRLVLRRDGTSTGDATPG